MDDLEKENKDVNKEITRLKLEISKNEGISKAKVFFYINRIILLKN